MAHEACLSTSPPASASAMRARGSLSRAVASPPLGHVPLGEIAQPAHRLELELVVRQAPTIPGEVGVPEARPLVASCVRFGWDAGPIFRARARRATLLVAPRGILPRLGPDLAAEPTRREVAVVPLDHAGAGVPEHHRVDLRLLAGAERRGEPQPGPLLSLREGQDIAAVRVERVVGGAQRPIGPLPGPRIIGAGDPGPAPATEPAVADVAARPELRPVGLAADREPRPGRPGVELGVADGVGHRGFLDRTALVRQRCSRTVANVSVRMCSRASTRRRSQLVAHVPVTALMR
jgi:hypothetical protein